MKKGLTELVFILDRSGSMAGMEEDLLGGFNSMIEKQKQEEGEAVVTTVLFSNDAERFHDRVPLEKVKPMTERDYRVGGCTALLDTIGDTIAHIQDVHRYIREEDRPEHTVFLITTDGLENASRRHSSREVKKTIRSLEEDGWKFVFVAANIDAVETAESIGISKQMSANYCKSKAGTRNLFRAMGAVASMVRKDEEISADWAESLKE